MFTKIFALGLSFIATIVTMTNFANAAPNVQNIEIADSVNITAPGITHIPLLKTSINIQENGTAIIEENFFLLISGKDKNATFLKDISKTIKTPFGNKKLDFEVTKVTHNNSITAFTVTSHNKYDTLELPELGKLAPGVHNFSIWYKIPYSVEHTAKNDVFFWNVFSHDWKQAVARIILTINHPTKITPTGQSFMLNGKQDTITQSINEGKGTYSFIRKEILYPKESLIFLETFTKNSFISGAPKSAVTLSTLTDLDSSTLIYIIGCVFILGYFITLWFTVSTEKRKLDKKFKKISRFFSPSGLRIFLKRTIDSKVILALIVNLAEKGIIKIEEKKLGQFTLTKLPKSGKKNHLSSATKLFLKYIFPKNVTSININTQTFKGIFTDQRTLRHILQKEYDRQFLKLNYSYFAFSTCIAILTIITAGLSLDQQIWPILTPIIAGLSTFIATGLLLKLFSEIFTATYKGKLKTLLIISPIFIIFLITSCVYTHRFLTETNNISAILLTIMMMLTPIFYHIFKRPTKLGKAVKNYTDMYINHLFPGTPLPEYFKTCPEKAIVSFSNLLPFAIAADKTEEHINRFAGILNTHTPLYWYQTSEQISDTFIRTCLTRLNEQIEKGRGLSNLKV